MNNQLILKYLMDHGLSYMVARCALLGTLIIVIILVSIISYFLANRFLVKIIQKVILKTKFKWDDIFVKNQVFERLSRLAPALVIFITAPIVFKDLTLTTEYIERATIAYMIFVTLWVIDALISSLTIVFMPFQRKHHFPIRPVLQGLRVIFVLLGIICVISIITDKPAWKLLSGLAGLTAVLMFVFKDTILGFVGGIQLTANNMVALGDWVEMPKYGADGDVIKITLTTVKVQNWDKTISTIPTYAMVSDSFKNWRGMSESGGRRIARSLTIDMNTIRFCDAEMVARFSKIKLLKDYLTKKQQEIEKHNASIPADQAKRINGRNLTNIGTYRAYIETYLRNNQNIHKGMTFLVRQLQPDEKGLPIQIYVFSKDQRWVQYEAIQADIFDHLIAILPEFDLRAFQIPSGNDTFVIDMKKNICEK